MSAKRETKMFYFMYDKGFLRSKDNILMNMKLKAQGAGVYIYILDALTGENGYDLQTLQLTLQADWGITEDFLSDVISLSKDLYEADGKLYSNFINKENQRVLKHKEESSTGGTAKHFNKLVKDGQLKEAYKYALKAKGITDVESMQELQEGLRNGNITEFKHIR